MKEETFWLGSCRGGYSRWLWLWDRIPVSGEEVVEEMGGAKMGVLYTPI